MFLDVDGGGGSRERFGNCPRGEGGTGSGLCDQPKGLPPGSNLLVERAKLGKQAPPRGPEHADSTQTYRVYGFEKATPSGHEEEEEESLHCHGPRQKKKNRYIVTGPDSEPPPVDMSTCGVRLLLFVSYRRPR